jgi:hypothetical protein
MKVGGFYEHQLPRPWTSESEHKLFKDGPGASRTVRPAGV